MLNGKINLLSKYHKNFRRFNGSLNLSRSFVFQEGFLKLFVHLVNKIIEINKKKLYTEIVVHTNFTYYRKGGKATE